MRTTRKLNEKRNVEPFNEFDKLNTLSDSDFNLIKEKNLINITTHEFLILVNKCNVLNLTFIKQIPFMDVEEYTKLRFEVK